MRHSQRPTRAGRPVAVATAMPEPRAELPRWAKDTPEETSYEIVMFDSDGGPVQSIELSRAEYIALKTHLAAVRGYQFGSVKAAIREVAGNEPLNGYHSRDSQHVARHLQIAREFYAAVAETVVPSSEAFNSQLEEIAR